MRQASFIGKLALLCVFFLTDLLSGCTGSNEVSPGPAAHDALPVQIAEINAAPVPDGVDMGVYAELRAELIRVLQDADRGVSTPPTGDYNAVGNLVLLGDDTEGWRLEWGYTNTGDYNLDRLVSINDLTPIGLHYQENSAGSGWLTSQVADGNSDGEVGINDITPIGQNYNAYIAGFNIYGADDSEGSWTLVGNMSLDAVPGELPYMLTYALAARDFAHYRVAPVDEFDVEGAASAASMSEGFPTVAVMGDLTEWESASIGTAGGTLSGPDEGGKHVSVTIPAGALDANVTLQLGESDGYALQDGEQQEGRFIYLSADDYIEFDPPAVLSVPYSGAAGAIMPGFRVMAHGNLAPLEPLELNTETGYATFNLNIACPFPGEHTASDPLYPWYGPGAWLVNSIIISAYQTEGEGYAYTSGFRPHLDGFTTNDIMGKGEYFGPSTQGMAAFSIWYYQNYRSQGRFAWRFLDPEVQRIIAIRAMNSVLLANVDALPPEKKGEFSNEKSFAQVKEAIRRSNGPVQVIYQDKLTQLKWKDYKVAYGYRGDTLLLYDPERPGEKIEVKPLDADHRVVLVDTDRYTMYESFENILLDATDNPPFGGSNKATITITSHDEGDYVPQTSTKLEGHITSGSILITELFVWNTLRQEIIKETIEPDGEFSVTVQLEPGENTIMLVTRGRVFDFSWRPGGTVLDVANDMPDGFKLIQGEEVIPFGHVIIDVEWDGYLESLYYIWLGVPYIDGQHQDGCNRYHPGSLVEPPYATWEDMSEYDDEDHTKPDQGHVKFVISQLHPGTYVVKQHCDATTLRVRHVKIRSFSGSSTEFDVEYRGSQGTWIGAYIDGATGEVTVVDEIF